MSEPKSLIIVPTYNERENLSRLVGAVLAEVPETHILVVDDASPDGTGEIADELAAGDERIQVMHRAGKLGLGTAYIAGFKHALAGDYDLIQEMDCDFSHDPRHLPEFRAAIEGADLVLGSRYVPGGGTLNWPISRQILSRGGSLYARSVLGLPYRDLTGGFKCFRRRVLEALPLDSVSSEGYAFQIEMTWRAHRASFQIREIPITFAEREVGASKMSRRIFWEGVTMCWRLRLGLVDQA